jgi:hypothetical protein
MKVLDVPSSGSVNWRTASRNRNGQYIRNRSIPVQPRSTAQRAIRGFLVLASQSWKALGADDQMAWKTFGSLHPRTDSLGQSNAPTGEQAFVGISCTSQLLGDGLIFGPPPAEPDMSGFVEGILDSSGATFTISGQVCPAGGRIMIWATKPTTTGRHFFGAPTYLQSTAIDQTTPIDISVQLAARWGTVPAGSVVQITQIPVVNGITGSPATSQIVIGSGTQMAAPVIAANFTLTGNAGSITYTVINAAVPELVTSYQFQVSLLTPVAYTERPPVIVNPADDPQAGTVKGSLAPTHYLVQMRWYGGSASGLPSAWSTSEDITVT